MRKFNINIKEIVKKHKSFDLLLLVGSQILAYGLLIPYLHYYIDDMYWVWTWNTFGHPGITQYFSTNRPIWGLIYQLTLPVLSISPILAHVFALTIRIITTILFYLLIKKLWPENRKVILVCAIIFGLYPGFALQSIAITYSHIFVILSCFLASLYLTIIWVNTNAKKALIFSLLLSLINLLTLEYFFTLEFVRLFIIWILFSRQCEGKLITLKKTLIHYLPYFFLILSVIIFRTTVLTQIQTYRYHFNFLSNFAQAPINTLVALGIRIFKDFYITTIGAWEPAFRIFISSFPLNKTAILFIFISLIFSLSVVFYLLLIQSPNQNTKNNNSREILVFGALSILCAGWPFWLTYIPVTQYDLHSRFTLPFLFGAAILIAFIYLLLSRNKLLSSIFVFLALFTSLFFQITTMNDFRNEWKQNRELMWQIHWRIPDLRENTLLLITDYPNQYYDVASLATELATLYPKESPNYTLPYFVLYSRNVDEDYNGLRAGIQLQTTNITATFSGSTSQMIAAQYQPGICFRLLDPEIDGVDAKLPQYLQSAAQLSDLALIKSKTVISPYMYYFGQEPKEPWCYFYEKADLAKQNGNWSEVAKLYDLAKEHGYGFNTDREKYIFIESFANLGRWNDANLLVRSMMIMDVKDGLCALSKRIDQNTPDSAEKTNFLSDLQNLVTCN